MMKKSAIIRITVLVGLMVMSLTLPGWAKSPKMKMTTEIPPGIATPDKLETRLGTLTSFQV